MTKPSSASQKRQTQYLARELEKLKKAQRDKGSTPQLGTSSVHDNGTMYYYDIDGNLKTTVGYLHDGTTTLISQNGPVPPAPTAPTVEVLNGAVKIIWDGVFVDSLVAPEDLARIDIRIVPDAVTDPLTVPPSGVLLAQNWGQAPLPLEPGDYYAALISWTQSGNYHVSELSEPFDVDEISVNSLRINAFDGAPGYIAIEPSLGDYPEPMTIQLADNSGNTAALTFIGGYLFLDGTRVGLGSDGYWGGDFEDGVTLSEDGFYVGVQNKKMTVNTTSVEDVGYTSDQGVEFYTNGRFLVESAGDAVFTAGGLEVFRARSADGEPLFASFADTAAAENAVITSGGALRRSTSSRRYKDEIAPLEVEPALILRAEPVTYVDKRELEKVTEAREVLPLKDTKAARAIAEEIVPEPTRHVGFIAEQLDEVGLGQFVVYDDEGRPDAIAYSRLTAAIVPLLKQQQERLDALEKAVEKLSV